MAQPSGMDKLTERLRKAVMPKSKKNKERADKKINNNNININISRGIKSSSPITPLNATTPPPPPRQKSVEENHITVTPSTPSTASTASSSSSSFESHSGRTGGLTNVSTPTNAGRKSDSKVNSDVSGSTLRRVSGGFGSGSGSGSRRPPRPDHLRSASCGGGTRSNMKPPPPPAVQIAPCGNIFPSGKVLTTGMRSPKMRTVLGSGNLDYGHGSIMWSKPTPKDGGRRSNDGGGGGVSEEVKPLINIAAEELKKQGNEYHKQGNFYQALNSYDRAILISPENAAYHFNRAAALMGLYRLPEAIKECEVALKLDPQYLKVHQRLGALFISLGQVENARSHLTFPGFKPDQTDLKKLHNVEFHLERCTNARRAADWVGALREVDATIASGADSSPPLYAFRAEVLLELRKINDAVIALSCMPQFESATDSYSQSRFFGMLCEAYPWFVRTRIALSQGRFEDASVASKKADAIDARNVEVSLLVKNVRLVGIARTRGNELFKSERFTEASLAYEDGLKFHPQNPILYCNKAACHYKLQQWEKSLNDCNQALFHYPNYHKALLRRAACYSKLDRWDEALKDYVALRKDLPFDNEIAEEFFHALIAVKQSRGEEVSNMKFGGEVELVTGLEQLRASISPTSPSVVLYKTLANPECQKISMFMDTLCNQYPLLNFLMVDIEKSPALAQAENVRTVPTIKIYRCGCRVKDMINPSAEVLEASVRHYSRDV